MIVGVAAADVIARAGVGVVVLGSVLGSETSATAGAPRARGQRPLPPRRVGAKLLNPCDLLQPVQLRNKRRTSSPSVSFRDPDCFSLSIFSSNSLFLTDRNRRSLTLTKSYNSSGQPTESKRLTPSASTHSDRSRRHVNLRFQHKSPSLTSPLSPPPHE